MTGTKRVGDFWSKSVWLIFKNEESPFFKKVKTIFWVLSKVGEIARGGSVAVALAKNDTRHMTHDA